MGIGQALTSPLFFASNAIYLISVAPRWLRFISRVNPLTYQVEALRSLMLEGMPIAYGTVTDHGVSAAVTILLIVLGGRLSISVIDGMHFPMITQSLILRINRRRV